MFRRKRKDESAQSDAVDEVRDEELDEELPEQEVTDGEAPGAPSTAADPAAAGAAGGPYDIESAPSDGLPRVDLGALRVPLVEGLEVRLDVDQESGQPSALVLVDGESMLQIGAFAAPRTSGIWTEVRAEIVETLAAAGGACAEQDGPMGVELKASIPTGHPGEFTDARFVGVDRPRWFLRGLLTGPAAVDAGAAERLESVLRATVVVRGTDAMPIRDPLPLKLPTEAPQGESETGDSPTLEQLDPGPTITETR